METTSAEKMIIKKDFFIKSRKEDIRKFYEFSPKILGRGAYGVVYKARLIQPPQNYRVVKLIAKKLVKNPDTLQVEIDILRKLDHPMIVRLYQTFQDEKNLYLVQDFCEGGELFQRLEHHGNFNEEDARELFLQMIKCIKYLHSQKICHRDLKPENFLMNSSKTLELKIIDFGLSFEWKKDMRTQLLLDKRNKLIGTSYYIAPEVLSLDYDQRCDIWSAGVILYILVTAAPPFDGDDDRKIMENVKSMKYSLDIPEAKRLSPELKDLIRKILLPAEKRITIEEILAHPWMVGKLDLTPLKIDFKKLKNFANFSKLKALAVSFIATQLPEKDIHYLSQLFSQIDTNSDGFLTIEELKVALQKQKENTTLAELKNIMDQIDTDKNGKINYTQFLACCLETSYIQNEQYLEYIFRSFDKDHSGTISRNEIKEILQASDLQHMAGNAIDELIESCDKNKDGEIDYLEFLESMGLKKST